MTPTQAVTTVKAQLIQIGVEVVPVYGDQDSGWSLDAGDLSPQQQCTYRYSSLDELIFALLNFNASPEGRA
jgi:hypothetical protein